MNLHEAALLSALVIVAADACSPPQVALPPVAIIATSTKGPRVGVSLAASQPAPPDINLNIELYDDFSPYDSPIGAISYDIGARYAYDSAVNHLTAKGFEVVRLPLTNGASVPSRVVSIWLLDASARWFDVALWKKKMRSVAQLECVVLGSSYRAAFSQTYAASIDLDTPWLNWWYRMPSTIREAEARQVAAVIDEAVIKMCDDPSFIAAIALSSAAAPHLP